MSRMLIGLMISLAVLIPAHANAQAKAPQGAASAREAQAADAERERVGTQKAEQQRAALQKAEQQSLADQQKVREEVAARARAAVASRANIRFDISIADEGGGAPLVRKAVSLLVADRGYASSRSQARFPLGERAPGVEPRIVNPGEPFPLNIDVGAFNDLVEIQDDGRVRARVSFEYQPYASELKALPGHVQGSSRLLFESGRKVVFVQSADAITDRRTTIEVTATVLK